MTVLAELSGEPVHRVYCEFADGSNRGRAAAGAGRPDAPFDATTAMALTWHRVPTGNDAADASIAVRQIDPTTTDWRRVEGDWRPFWHRPERIYRAVITSLQPDAVYEVRCSTTGSAVHLHTMPASLTDRAVTIAAASDLQRADFTGVSRELTRGIANEQPDFFIGGGDFVSDNGLPGEQAAKRWASYLDGLYGFPEGYFLIDKEIKDRTIPRVLVPHVNVLGNHETGRKNHLRWPTCVATNSREPGYPTYIPAQWMEQLFHWPFRSEGFFSELRYDHPNADPAVREGTGMGGFGTLSFGDYLLLIVLDNSQNYETVPDPGLRDWRGDPITDRWPWYGEQFADIRQDRWLDDVLNPGSGSRAGDRYTHILPVWHRGLYTPNRPNMSLKNREILTSWLAPLADHGVRFIQEGHEHLYARTVPIGVGTTAPSIGTWEHVRYEPNTWSIPESVPDRYVRDYFTVKCGYREDEIVGWSYDGVSTYHDPDGFIVGGHGGWGAGRGAVGARGAGQAGWWFVDPAKGGEVREGPESYHMRTIELEPGAITVNEFLAGANGSIPPTPTYRYRTDPEGGPWEWEAGDEWTAYTERRRT